MSVRNVFRVVVLLVLVCSALAANGQTLTVEQLESQWRSLYAKGAKLSDAHQYEKALQQYSSAIDLLQANDALGTSYHMYALIRQAELYHAMGDGGKVESTTNEILKMRDAIRPGSKKHIDYLYNLGVFFSATGKYQQGIDALTEAENYPEALDKMSGYRSRIYHRIALCHFMLGDLDSAIKNEEQCIKADDNKTPAYLEALEYYLYKKHDWTRLEENLATCFDYAREPILRNFASSKATERAEYWSRHGLLFTDFLPVYALSTSSAALIGYTYDAALLSKGVLLAAQNKSDEINLSSGNPELLASYAHYKELKGKKNKTLDEEFELQALSDVFLKYQKEHKNEFREDFRIRWQDVKDAMGGDDVAIEFLDIPTATGNADYVALVLKKAFPAPKMIKLCSFEDVKAIAPNEYYTTSKLYDLIWGPLQAELEGSSTVYFSPSGFLYNTGIEYVPDEDGNSFNNLHNAYRLSSTKELAIKKKGKLSTSILIGGVNYDTKVSEMAASSKNFEKEDTERSLDLDSLDIRAASASGGVAYLPGTMEEVEQINDIFMDGDVSAKLYCGNDGSEPSFYEISNDNPDILHIATHGFYYANKNVGKKKDIDSRFTDLNLHYINDDLEVVNEDKMLRRSGLLLAGANNRLKRINLPSGIDDGILYADEISNLNLSSVNLLVLSACQSGLGDVAASEGVFGLQRGFKLAGVNSIVMSLWKVDDNATRILMTEMYKNIVQGKSVREALVNAQLYLRTQNNGEYDAPKYWAAFILLDSF